MKLSVIVPVFNMAAGEKLNFCLDSLVAQTITDYEIIVVDDASTDGSLAIIKDYEKKYPGLVKAISYPDNRHQGGARNEGLRSAQGEWIAFIDSDDWVTPDYYEKLLKKAEETGADVVSTNFSNVGDHTFTPGKEVKPGDYSKFGVMDEERHKKFFLSPGSMVMKIYRRELIFDNGLDFPEHMFYEDNAVAPVWSVYFKHCEHVDEPMYFYYQHASSTVHTVTKERCLDRMKACGITLSEMKERGFYEEYKEEIEARFIRLYLVNTLFGYMIDGRDRRYSFVREIKKGMLSYFPDFRKNKYYPSIPDAEQQKMIDLLLKNSLAFYCYYSLLWWYRKRKK